VQNGDFLLGIAKKVYGSTDKWMDLIEKNKIKYPSIAVQPYVVVPGWSLDY